jgi:chorismate dehydratase
MPAPLRVGSVPYLVGRPLDLGLEHEPGIEYRRDVPARLVEDLRAGALDVALVSSIELFQRPGYRYLPRFAVAGRGAVGSVQVFLRKPLAEVESIALDPASRTAQTLVRVLLAERPGGAPRFIELAQGVDPRSVPADAWLRIGDRALREHLAGEHDVFNPSEHWCARVRLPFVFAPWIVRPGAPLAGHVDAFQRAAERGLAALGPLAEEAASRWDVPLADCRAYLEDECLFEPGAELEPALAAFGAAARALGLTHRGAHPEPYGAPRAHA